MKTRALPFTLSWSFDFNHPVEKVWPLVSNTDRMNRAVGLSAVNYSSEANPVGGSIRFGETRVAGFKLKWIESPYEWVINQEFGVQRDYSQGPLVAMDMFWTLTPQGPGCRVTQTVNFQPRSRVFEVITKAQLILITKNSFLKAYANLATFLDDASAATSAFALKKSDLPSIDKSSFETVFGQFKEVNVPDDLAQKLTKYIFETPQADLIRLKPFAIAKKWSVPRLDILTAFLRGTNRGIFSLYWDLICPRCKGAKSTLSNLSSLKSKYHCDSCNIDFSAEFDRSVEVSFGVHPRIRKISGGEYCVGGPQNTPHFVSQVRLAPQETQSIQLSLKEGVYRIRSLQSNGGRILEVKPGEATSEIKVVFNNDKAELENTFINPGEVKISLENQQNHEVVVAINQVAWMEDVCTASYVTSIQEFRNRFASEVLDPGQEISVSRIALLFTDLKGSTQMYQNIGDAKAYKLVRQHFEVLSKHITQHEGAIVKTLGDAVMAAFSSPAEALKAAIEIQHAFGKIEALGSQSKIKIGIHAGSCFIINADGHLDYFGTNVNIAARTTGQCEGGDIIVTQYMMNDPQVQKLVQSKNLPSEKVTRHLRGFDDHFVLYRLKCSPAATPLAEKPSETSVA